MHGVGIGALMALCPHGQDALPEALRDSVQAAIEPALGEGLEVAMLDEEGQGMLVAAGEELGGDEGDGHDFGGAVSGLAVIAMSEGIEQFVKEAIDRDNLVLHGRLLAEVGVSKLTLQGSLPALQA